MSERRPGPRPDEMSAKEKKEEKELQVMMKKAAKNLSEGGFSNRLLEAMEKQSDPVAAAGKADPKGDLFPTNHVDEFRTDVEPGGIPLASPEKIESVLTDLRLTGMDMKLIKQIANRPLIAIRFAEALTRNLESPEVALEAYQEGVTNFYKNLWKELLPGKDIEVPPMPPITQEQHEAFDKFKMMPMYLPAITEADYPKDFVKPNWTQYLQEADIERRPLEGVWVLVETIKKPNWDDEGGYGAGDADPLGRVMNLETRFEQSWDDIHAPGGPLTVAGQELHIETALPSAEQWNASANLLLSMNKNAGESFQDLGSTRSYEWTENRYGSDDRLIVGDAGDGGLAYVLRDFAGNRYDGRGFRVLAVIKK